MIIDDKEADLVEQPQLMLFLRLTKGTVTIESLSIFAIETSTSGSRSQNGCQLNRLCVDNESALLFRVARDAGETKEVVVTFSAEELRAQRMHNHYSSD